MNKIFALLKYPKFAILILFYLLTLKNIAISQSILDDYNRAVEYLPFNVFKNVYNLELQPNWINNTSKFWYENINEHGKKFIVINPKLNSKQSAFDHKRLAHSLSIILDTTFSANNLPFSSLEYSLDEKSIQFMLKDKNYNCNLNNYVCNEIGKEIFVKKNESISPDGNMSAFVQDYNLFIKKLKTNEVFQLTFDGKEYYSYASLSESRTTAITDRLSNNQYSPQIIWSPDSQKLITHRLDERKVRDLFLIQSATPEHYSKLHTFKMPLPGDNQVPKVELIIFDIITKRKTVIKSDPLLVHAFTPFDYQLVWWIDDSKGVYFLKIERGYKHFKLVFADGNSGQAKTIFEEISTKPLNYNLNIFKKPNIRILEKGKKFIWFSQKDNWGHLYLYDSGSGKLINQITSGNWNVRDIIHINESAGWIYFTGNGREKGINPYYIFFYRIKLDGSNLELLTPENASHKITVSPELEFFVDTFSRVNYQPRTVLRSKEGKLILTLEKSDIKSLTSKGWKYPIEFRSKARDNTTDIFGVVFHPSNFDSSKKYTVIDYVYPGPQTNILPTTFPKTNYMARAQALAELGFIVVCVDGLGTPYRSKSFHEFSYGNLGDAGGLLEHILFIKQFAESHNYIDTSKVGIWGHSGGGFAAARAILKYPDFFKVAVSSAGNHDSRGYLAVWLEQYQGYPDNSKYAQQSNYELVKNLKGKLLLVFGDMDDNVSPSLSIKLIDRLIKENKDFDLLLLPNRNHSYVRDDLYFIRKMWDYFVEHLMGIKPPENYRIIRD